MMRFLCCTTFDASRASILLFTAVFIGLFILSLNVHAATAEAALWRLQAFHLHHHTDVPATAATAAVAPPTLMGEHDLISDTCALDTVVTALSATKNAATSAATTQSIDVQRRNFTLVPTVVRAATTHKSAAPEGDVGMPESVASAALRRRDAAPTTLRTTGVVDLGMFHAEVVDASKVVANTLTDLEGEDEAAALPALLDPGDETEGLFEASFFVGDFTRALCVSAAVYATAQDVGNLSVAIAAWVPHSVSPACAMRLSPNLRSAAGLSLSEEGLLPSWPPTGPMRCHLSEGDRFSFSFTPAQAQAKRPIFCAYEKKKATGEAAAPTPGTRRQVRCEVYLDVQVLTWYGGVLAELKPNASVLKIAAAVTEGVGAATPASVKRRSASVASRRAEGLAQTAFFHDSGEDDAYVENKNLTAVASRVAGKAAAVPRSAELLAATTGRISGISRYRGTLWCTSSTAGRGFWFSSQSECTEVIEAKLSSSTSGYQTRISRLREVGFVIVVGAGVAGFTGMLTARVVKTVRLTNRRRAATR